MPINFLRHYYDVYQLLNQQQIIDFIGTNEYHLHKNKRFRSADEKDFNKNEAFRISDKETRLLYKKEYQRKSAIYFGKPPNFDDIINKINEYIDIL